MKKTTLKSFLKKHQDHILVAISILIGIIVIFHYTSQGLKQKQQAMCGECYNKGSADTRDKIWEITLREGGVNITNSGGQIMRLVLPQ